MKPYLLQTLKELALLGALRERVEISSQELANQLQTSQQTASRYLLELDEHHLIKREHGIKKQLIMITSEGAHHLEAEFIDYQHIFSLKEEIVFVGTVISGLGEGTYYTSQQGYLDQFKKKLGFTPYPGTFNVRIDPVERNKLRLLKNFGKGVDIDSFESNKRTFGGVTCFLGEVDGIEGAIVMPKRSHYSEIIEFISPIYVRGRLNIKDGAPIEIRIYLEESLPEEPLR